MSSPLWPWAHWLPMLSAAGVSVLMYAVKDLISSGVTGPSRLLNVRAGRALPTAATEAVAPVPSVPDATPADRDHAGC